jgi:hypothetical protein
MEAGDKDFKYSMTVQGLMVVIALAIWIFS